MIGKTHPKVRIRMRRRMRIRKKISGTEARPRLSVFRSNRHIVAQLIDDERGVTLAAASSFSKDLRDAIKGIVKSHLYLMSPDSTSTTFTSASFFVAAIIVVLLPVSFVL